MNPFAARLLLACAVFAVCAALAEGAARALHQRPWYDDLIGRQAASARYDYQTDLFGLRGPFHPEPKAEDTRRVLVLGDSFTFGFGIPESEDVFPARLEERLGKRPPVPGIARYQVRNGGIAGSLTSDWLYLWNRVGRDFEPDVVLIVFFLRDGTRTGSIPEFFQAIRDDVVRRNRASFGYRHSALYRVFRDRLDRAAVAERYTDALHRAYLGSAEETAEWRRARRNLRRLRDRARRRGAEVGLAVFPVLVELEGDYPFQEIVDLLLRFAAENDLPAHDLLPAFRGRRGPDLWVSAYDQHPNERAHAIAAESLEPFVGERLRAAELRERSAPTPSPSGAAADSPPPPGSGASARGAGRGAGGTPPGRC